jgi:hypothetical protein
LNNQLYVFPLLMKHDPTGEPGFEFAIDGVTMIRAPIGADGIAWDQVKQANTPLFTKSSRGINLVFGAGIMANTAAAGAPSPDGYIYVYGYEDGSKNKKLVTARVLPDQFEQFDKWTYWDGSNWTAKIEDAATLANQISPELSITSMIEGPYAGKYMLVYQKATVGSETAYRVADQPWGPFGDETILYSNNESDSGNGVFTYNAKAHPHLSKPGELLITYNVNTADGLANMANADIYRPRWVKLREIAKE